MDVPLTLLLLTYEPGHRRTAEPCLRAALDNIRYSGPLDVHIADDGSAPEHRARLAEIAGGYAHVRNVGVTDSERGGYGASYNLATQAIHPKGGVVLPLEDDWRLMRPFDLDGMVETLTADTLIECIRLGYLGFTQELRGAVISSPAGMLLLFDPDSEERHVAAGHPRIETVAWERAVGPWCEGLAAGATEFEWCGRPAARTGVAWPLFLRPSDGLFVHTGAVELGELVPERQPEGSTWRL